MDSFADTQPVGGSISLEADFSVKTGRLEVLQDLRALMLHHAGSAGPTASFGDRSKNLPEAGGPTDFSFDARLAADNLTFSIRCAAPMEEPLRQMLLRIGPDLAQLEANADLTRLHCTGAASPELQKALTRFNSTFA